MRVDPARLVELARSCDDASVTLAEGWQEAAVGLRGACGGIGNATAAAQVARSYDEAVVAAEETVASLVAALRAGVGAVLDAARDATSADEAVAAHLHQVRGHGIDRALGHGGRGSGQGLGPHDGGAA